MVGKGEARALEVKIQTLLNYAQPIEKKDMRTFQGFSNYYMCFVPGYGAIVISLTEAIRKSAPDKIVWMTNMQELPLTLKEALSKDVTLVILDGIKKFILLTDASGWNWW